MLAGGSGGAKGAARFSRAFRFLCWLWTFPPLYWQIRNQRRPVIGVAEITGCERALEPQSQVLHQVAKVLHRAAMAGPLRSALGTFFENSWEYLVETDGTPIAGPGIAVAAHQNLAFLPMMLTFDPDRFVLIGWNRQPRDTDARLSSEEQDVILTKHLMLARKNLKAGGWVGILADGHIGQQGRVRTICGVERPFQIGFAMLALAHGVPVQFVRCSWRPSGKAKIVFGEEFEADRTLPIDAQIDAYLDWYCERLERVYREETHSITGHHLTKKLERIKMPAHEFMS